ncbi:unnamed protein product, partial [marine sediment metagenome]
MGIRFIAAGDKIRPRGYGFVSNNFNSFEAYLFGGLNLVYSIYFSAVSFTALGYGSWVD